MNDDQWKIVQKIHHRVPAAPCISHADSSLPLNYFQSQLSPPVVKRGILMKRIEDNESEDQTDIKSLIGSPFVIRSCHLDDSKLEEDTEANRKIKCKQSSCNVRGILKISPCKDKNGADLTGEVEDNVEFSQVNELDWPSISQNQPQSPKEIHLLNTSGSARNSKSWSKVLKTAPRPHSIEETKSGARNGDPGEEEYISDKLVAKKKKKRESGQSGTATERRHDQPLLLEFESLFESLQVQGSKKVIASGGAPIVLNKPAIKQDTHHKEMLHRGNILDSSAPATRRGKERETPKKKRPSALRKVISYEKEQKKTGVLHVEPTTAVNDSTETGAIVEFKVKPSIHNRRFREYCNHLVKEEINSCVEQFLSNLVRFQDRMYLKDPIKAKGKRRYVCGLREVLKHLNLRKLKCVVLPPNLDRIRSKGGINDVIQQILDKCSEQQLPVIFALSRRRLAMVLKKCHKVGCVGIFSYDGAEVHYKLLLTLVETARVEYEAKLATVDSEENTNSDLKTNATDLSQCDIVEADISIESNSESDDSDIEQDISGQQHGIMSSPWKIFFEPSSNHNQVIHPSESPQLNVNASEFVPSFKFNVDAKEFVPVL